MLRLMIDRDNPTPAYLQLKNLLAGAITGGNVRPGDALPSERGLADALKLSRMTVRRALDELVSSGLVERRHGSGTYALAGRLEQTVDRVLGFTDEARLLGFTPGSVLLEAVPVDAGPEVAAQLHVALDAKVLRVTRLRTANGEPLALQESHLIPELLALPLALLRATGSLYRTIASCSGLRPHHARQVVSARLPAQAESSALRLNRHTPVLAITRTTYDETGRAFEYARSAYRSDKYRLALELRTP